MNKLVIFCIGIISCSVLGQKAAIISEHEGCFHGGYESFHENGKTKAKGNFYYNRRIGDWKIYDEEGALLVHRFYDSLGNVSVLVPETADDEVIRLLNKPLHVPARDSTGKYQWSQTIEGNVIYSKRVLSYLPKKDNAEL